MALGHTTALHLAPAPRSGVCCFNSQLGFQKAFCVSTSGDESSQLMGAQSSANLSVSS